MNTFWEIFKNPPFWMLAILVTILISHLLTKALGLPKDKLIPVLEFFVVVTLGFITAHTFLFPSVTGKNDFAASPTFLVSALIVFTVVSVGLYWVSERWLGK